MMAELINFKDKAMSVDKHVENIRELILMIAK